MLNKNEIAGKIPEIEKSLSVIEALVKKQVRQARVPVMRWWFKNSAPPVSSTAPFPVPQHVLSQLVGAVRL